MRITIERSWARLVTDVFIEMHREPDSSAWCLQQRRENQDLEAVRVPAGQTRPIAGHLSPDDTQDLIDALWGAGFRPTNGGSVADIVTAKDKHIDDLRAVLFAAKLLK